MTDHFTNDFLVDYVHGELRPADDALAHDHIASCAACRADYEAEVALGEMLRSSARADERELPPFVKAAVWEQIRAAKPSAFASLGALLRPAFAVPLAALVLVAGFFASPLGHRDARPTVAASYYFQTHAMQSAQTTLSVRSAPQIYEAAGNTNQGLVSDAFDSGYPATGALSGGR